MWALWDETSQSWWAYRPPLPEVITTVGCDLALADLAPAPFGDKSSFACGTEWSSDIESAPCKCPVECQRDLLFGFTAMQLIPVNKPRKHPGEHVCHVFAFKSPVCIILGEISVRKRNILRLIMKNCCLFINLDWAVCIYRGSVSSAMFCGHVPTVAKNGQTQQNQRV